MAAEALINKFKIHLVKRNLRTPYGEVDLVFRTRLNTYLIVEVKLDLVGREGDLIWSRAQRNRFLKSRAYLASQLKRKVEMGFCLIKRERLSFYFGELE